MTPDPAPLWRPLHDALAVDARGHTEHPCTVEGVADLDFEPWTGECFVPSNVDWPALGRIHLPFARMAWMMNTKTKGELAEVLAGMDDEDPTLVERFCADMQDTAAFFEAFRYLMATAQDRLLGVLFAMTADLRHAHRFTEAA